MSEGAVVVTGGASGIGAATAEVLRAAGRRVVIWDNAAVEEPDALRVDVSDAAAIRSAWQRSAEEYAVTGVVNAAGIFATARLDELSDEHWDTMLGVNLRGTFLVCRAAFPYLRSRGGGSIVNVASIAALQPPLTACSAYAASKGGVLAFTRAIAREGSAAGIRANCVIPAAIETPMMTDPLTAEQREMYERRSPSGRFGTAREVAATIAFLLSDDASFVSGANVEVSGG